MSKQNQGQLYLIPNLLGGEVPNDVLPDLNLQLLQNIDAYVVENIKIARRFLRKCGYKKDFDTVTFFELNKHTDHTNISSFLKPLKEGKNLGVLSDAGCPGVADPGAQVVALAQKQGFTVKPLVGPSSILLTLMGSGFNGQSFSFHGYLPRERRDRIKKLLEMERNSNKTSNTNLFMDTPFRNNHVIEDLLENLNPDTLLCIGSNLTLPNEKVTTKTVALWKKQTPNLHKMPVMFAIGTIV